MQNLLTPKQVAQAIGVSEASLKRWCDKGLIRATRTGGGHRRLALEDVMAYLRNSGRQLISPQVLQLPAIRSTGERATARSLDHLIEALTHGDEARADRIIFDMYLAKHSVADIGDHVIAEAFRQIGDRWECNELEPYQERRACEIVGRVLTQLRTTLPAIRSEAPHAIGGTLEGDIYRLPTAFVELTLREAGWRAESLGTNLPAATVRAAIEQLRPKLFWLSVSHIPSTEQFLGQYAAIYATAQSHNMPVAVGGRALDSTLRREMQYTVFCDNLRHLVSFVDSFRVTAS